MSQKPSAKTCSLCNEKRAGVKFYPCKELPEGGDLCFECADNISDPHLYRPFPPPGFARYNPAQAAQDYHWVEIQKAKELLTIGQEYRITGGMMGRFESHLTLEGVPGRWSSALFDCDIHNAGLRKAYI